MEYVENKNIQCYLKKENETLYLKPQLFGA